MLRNVGYHIQPFQFVLKLLVFIIVNWATKHFSSEKGAITNGIRKIALDESLYDSHHKIKLAT